MSTEITDRDINLLNSLSQWLETRAQSHNWAIHKGLMLEYARSIESLKTKLEPLAISKPVTLDELFGKKEN